MQWFYCFQEKTPTPDAPRFHLEDSDICARWLFFSCGLMSTTTNRRRGCNKTRFKNFHSQTHTHTHTLRLESAKSSHRKTGPKSRDRWCCKISIQQSINNRRAPRREHVHSKMPRKEGCGGGASCWSLFFYSYQMSSNQTRNRRSELQSGASSIRWNSRWVGNWITTVCPWHDVCVFSLLGKIRNSLCFIDISHGLGRRLWKFETTQQAAYVCNNTLSQGF